MIIEESKILSRIKESDVVLDVGGGAEPFFRANFIIDLLPYSKRSNPQKKPFFKKNSWYQQDICSAPLPFSDKAINFVICSHTLEDIRDPIFVCKELNRVGKAGYIEIPSRALESTFGVDPFPLGNRYPGINHHRWLIELKDNELIFTAKTPYLTVFPEMSVNGKNNPIISFFWKGNFLFKEQILNWNDCLFDLARFKSEFENKNYRELVRTINRKMSMAKVYRKVLKIFGKNRPFDFKNKITI